MDSSPRRKGIASFLSFSPLQIWNYRVVSECLVRGRLESEIICSYVTFKVFQEKLVVITVNQSFLRIGLWIIKQRVKDE